MSVVLECEGERKARIPGVASRANVGHLLKTMYEEGLIQRKRSLIFNILVINIQGDYRGSPRCSSRIKVWRRDAGRARLQRRSNTATILSDFTNTIDK